MRTRFQTARGFTLVEILAVVVILGIASAIIIPQISSRDDLRAGAAARVLMADLIYAQNRSIAMQKPHFVQFSGQTYTVMTRDATNLPLYAITNPITKNSYAVTFNTAGTGLTNTTMTGWNFANKSIIGFDELGSPFAFDTSPSPSGTSTSLASDGTIAVTAGVASLTIHIEPFTGETSVQ